MNGRRSTIRLRLTVLYAGAFFLAGAILIALMYFYLEQSLDPIGPRVRRASSGSSSSSAACATFR